MAKFPDSHPNITHQLVRPENGGGHLAAWWRHCKGDESFRTAMHFCAGQLELALDGELPAFNSTVHQGGKRPEWLT